MTNTSTIQLSSLPGTSAIAPFVSVIVPVFNDADRLPMCLAALERQTYASDRYEVIVVDNGSDPAKDIPGIAARFEHTVITQELTPGSYVARNKGLSLAKGEVIAFTDSDCVPAPDWLEQGVSYLLANPNCGLLAGKIEIFSKDPDHITAIELYDRIVMGFPQREFLEKRKAAATANVFTWKRVIDHVGPFNAQMKSHGDLEWGRRVFQAGYEQIYADEACVGHPARFSFDEIYTRTIRLAGGSYDLHVRQEPSLLKRNKRFLRLLVDDLALHLGASIMQVLKSESLPQPGLKLKVVGLVVVMKYASAIEKIRLKFGGKTHRG